MTAVARLRELRGPSSWVDRLTARVEESGVPEALVYPSLAAVLAAVVTVASWAAGSYDVGTLSTIQVLMAATTVFLVWMIAAINRSARAALVRVRPLFPISDEAFEALRHSVVDTPGSIDLAVATGWVLALAVRIVLDPHVLTTVDVTGTGPGFAVALLVVFAFVVAASAYLVKVAHLAWSIRRLSGLDMTVSLWELGPLHGFSILTARMSLGIVAAIVSVFVARRDSFTDPGTIAAAIVGSAAATAVFVVPLLRIHDRLVSEKGRLRAAGARTMEEAVIGLHRAIEAGDLASMDAHYKAVAAVEIELRTVGGIPTWPWLPDTFRWVAGALMFPIVLFVLQWVISRMLGT